MGKGRDTGETIYVGEWGANDPFWGAKMGPSTLGVGLDDFLGGDSDNGGSLLIAAPPFLMAFPHPPQERGGSNSFTHEALMLKYKLDNQFELVFVVSDSSQTPPKRGIRVWFGWKNPFSSFPKA